MATGSGSGGFGRRRRLVLVAAALTGVALAGLGGVLLAINLQLTGSWPFTGLRRPVYETPLANGGTLRVTGVEDRGWLSDGFAWTADYRAPGATDSTTAATWLGHAPDVTVDLAGPLVVVRTPVRDIFSVRTPAQEWRFFAIRFPGRGDPDVAPFLGGSGGLSEPDLRRFQSDLSEDEAAWRPNAEIQDFDPETRVLTVLVYSKIVRRLTLELSLDGTRLTLLTLERVRGT